MTTATESIISSTTILTIPTEKRTKCEVWTRVMGYHRPISQFNIGKKQEALERTYFNLKASFKSEEEEESECTGDCGSCPNCGSEE